MLFTIKSFVLQSGADLAAWRRDKRIAMALLFALLGVSFLGVQIRLFGLEIGDTVWVEPLDLGANTSRGASPAMKLQDKLEFAQIERQNAEEALKDLVVMIGYHSDRLDSLTAALDRMKHPERGTYAGEYADLTVKDMAAEVAEAQDVVLFLRDQYAKDASSLDDVVARENALEREYEIAKSKSGKPTPSSDSQAEITAYLAKSNNDTSVLR